MVNPTRNLDRDADGEGAGEHADNADARASVEDLDPAGLPSATSMHFVVLTLLVITITATLAGYLWQVLHAADESRVSACLSTMSGNSSDLIHKIADPHLPSSVAVSTCTQATGLPLTVWSLTGIGAVVSAIAVWSALTPWWTTRVGWRWRQPGQLRRLVELDPSLHPVVCARLCELVLESGLTLTPRNGPDPVRGRAPDRTPRPKPALALTFLVDPKARSRGAYTFGSHQHARICLHRGLLLELGHPHRPSSDQEPSASDKVRHELGHVRNRDIRPTSLTNASWHVFMVTVAVVYLVALTEVGARASLPNTQTFLALTSLTALLYWSRCAVLRVRELHADATAAHHHPAGTLPWVHAMDRSTSGAWLQHPYHPSWQVRSAALRDRALLYGSDPTAMLAAGVAIGALANDVAVMTIAAFLASPMGSITQLLRTSARHNLVEIYALVGPEALLVAFLVASLAFATTWRFRMRTLESQRYPVRAGLLAAGMSVGILVGDHLSVSYALAGTWGFFDSTPLRNLAVVAMSLAVLLPATAVLFRWAAECAALRPLSTGRRGSPRTGRATTVVVGALGFTPVAVAWFPIHTLPLYAQFLPGASGLARGFPASAVVLTHELFVGYIDLIPGTAFLFALPAVLLAVRALRPALSGAAPLSAGADRARADVGRAILRGLATAVASLILMLALMLWLRATTGAPRTHATAFTEYGLKYLVVVTENVTALCAALAALWTARRTDRAPLTLGMLTALVATGASALLDRQPILAAAAGWNHLLLNPSNRTFFYAVFESVTPVRAVLFSALLLLAHGIRTRPRPDPPTRARVRSRLRPRFPPRFRPRFQLVSGPRLLGSAAARSRISVLYLAVMLVVLAGGVYYYLTVALTS